MAALLNWLPFRSRLHELLTLILTRDRVDEVLHPGEVGVAAQEEGQTASAVVVFAEPVGVVEGRVGEDEVSAKVEM
jgi:hypothetical protein